MDYRPSVIVLGGDFADFLSLSAWEKSNKLSVEGRRYKLEIEAVNIALDKLLAFRKVLPKYNPRLIYIIGNHETRVIRYVEANPTLDGHMDIDTDLKLTQRGFEIVPYKEFIEISGTLFTHCPLNAAAQPISGKFAAQKAADVTSKSMVFFHTHQVMEYNCLRHGDEELIQIYNAGSYFEGPPPGGYSDNSTHATARLLSILSFYKSGRFDIEQLSLERLRKMYN
jgi:hypothetical protein